MIGTDSGLARMYSTYRTIESVVIQHGAALCRQGVIIDMAYLLVIVMQQF